MICTERKRIGCCITLHGFGHAARACAVMEALSALCPVCFEIVTTVPKWFFAQSLSASYTLHPISCDVGLVQKNALEEDLGQTLKSLESFYPLDQNLIDRVAVTFRDCELVICDIAPLGLAAAQRAGVTSVLIENFTWDWIYQSYSIDYPAFISHIHSLQRLYQQADYYIQAAPVCNPIDGALQVPPIARKRREKRALLRQQLQVRETDTLVLVTMGGIAGTQLPLAQMAEMEQCFVLPGAARKMMEIRGNFRLLPQDSSFYHPDLVAACDAVIGKVGYSTLAEVYQAGIPYGYIGRPSFRESASLAAFIDREMVSLEISWEQFQGEHWLDRVPELCRLPSQRISRPNGADSAAVLLHNLING